MPRIPLEWLDIEEIPLHQLHVINGKPTKKTKQMIVVELLGAKCLHCGYDEDIIGLDVDHIHGDANIEKGVFNRDKIFSLIILAYKHNITDALDIIHSRYQVLCCRCNKIKARKDSENHHNIALQLSNMGCIQHVRMMQAIIMDHIRGISNVL